MLNQCSHVAPRSLRQQDERAALRGASLLRRLLGWLGNAFGGRKASRASAYAAAAPTAAGGKQQTQVCSVS